MFRSLPFKNLRGKPLRTAVLVTLTALLALTFLAGTLTVSSLRSGLASLENRLGAEIIVVPYEATTKKSFENIVLQGSTGYFYMDKQLADKVCSAEGIGQCSSQFYLASTSAGCCSIPVQIIGFDGVRHFGDLELTCSTIVQPLEAIAANCVELVLSPRGENAPALICLPVSYGWGGTTRE